MRPDLVARMDATKVPYKIYAEVLDDATVEQFADCLEASGVVQGFLAPDAHLGYTAPIGSVYAVKDKIYCSFVGFDIGCGVSAIRTNIHKDDITKEQWTAIKNQILRDVPIGFNRHKKPVHGPFPDVAMTKFASDILLDTGSYQLGTLGGGKDYCFQAQRKK